MGRCARCRCPVDGTGACLLFRFRNRRWVAARCPACLADSCYDVEGLVAAELSLEDQHLWRAPMDTPPLRKLRAAVRALPAEAHDERIVAADKVRRWIETAITYSLREFAR